MNRIHHAIFATVLCAATWLAATPAAQAQATSDGAQIERLSLAVPGDGRPVLAWFDAASERIHVARCINPVCAGPLAVHVLDGLPRAGSGLSMALGANGYPVLSYRNDEDLSLQVTVCRSADCRLATHATIDADSFIGEHTSIAVPADGRPVVSYHDASRYAIKVARCDDAQCSGASITTVDWYLAGPHNALAIAPDGLPALAFQDELGALLYTHCGTPDCSGELSIAMVDGSAAGAGYEPSLAFDADGRPVMSYLASAPRRVTFARCMDAACEEPVVTEIEGFSRDYIGVDSPSLALTADGRPLITYRRTNAELKLASCNVADCEAGQRRVVKRAHASAPGTAIAIGLAGRALIAYVEEGNGGTRVKVTYQAARR